VQVLLEKHRQLKALKEQMERERKQREEQVRLKSTLNISLTRNDKRQGILLFISFRTYKECTFLLKLPK